MIYLQELSTDIFIKTTALTRAIDNYNVVLDKSNKCKRYKKPFFYNDCNYQIADDMQMVFDELEQERIHALNTIRELLDQGEDPNSPEETRKYFKYPQGLCRQMIVNRSPLRIAKDSDTISLLLERGANPSEMQTNDGFFSFLTDAYYNKEHLKIHTILSSVSLKLEPDDLYSLCHKYIKGILNPKSNANSSDYAFLANEDYKNKIADLLMAQINCPNSILSIIESISPDETHHVIAQLKIRFSQTLLLPIWTCLCLGFSESGSLFWTLPFELLKIILSNMLFSISVDEANETYNTYLLEREQASLEAFKILYPFMFKQLSYFKKVEPLDLHESITMATLHELAFNDELIGCALDLANAHYDNLSSSNNELIAGLRLWMYENDLTSRWLDDAKYQFFGLTGFNVSGYENKAIEFLEALAIDKQNETVCLDYNPVATLGFDC